MRFKHPKADSFLCRHGFHKLGEVHYNGPLSVHGAVIPASDCGLTVALGTIYAGTAITWTSAFAIPPNSTLTNPSTVSYIYKGGSGSLTTWTWPTGGGQITNPSTGDFSAELDTTALPGPWVIQAVGTGSCAAVNVAAFSVSNPPL